MLTKVSSLLLCLLTMTLLVYSQDQGSTKMPFLAPACAGHGEASTDPAAVCCSGYTPWEYDAKNGQPYQGFMCWAAACADEGRWAGPGGVGNHCCSGLTNVGGICVKPPSSPTTPSAVEERSSYILGPGDAITIRALNVEEISEKPVRIGTSGIIKFPMIGRIKAAGMTLEQLEAEITSRLKDSVNEPDVAVAITEYRSQPVSIMGSVNTPGVLHLEGRKTLFEVLSMAGGLKPDAGYSVKITRSSEFGAIPLPNATSDASGLYSVATVNLKSVMEARNPEENILICPFDVISVPKGELVYVIGDVRKSGGFILSEQETITVLQVLSRAEGLEKTAKPKDAKILRPVAGSSTRSEIPIDLKMVLAGQATDVALQSDDILFVPGKSRSALQTLSTFLAIGASSAIIWRY